MDKYTDQLKVLIGKLHDDNLDAVQNNGQVKDKQQINNFDDINEGDLIQDSEDERRNAENSKKLGDILKHAANGPTNERKEKLKVRLLNES